MAKHTHRVYDTDARFIINPTTRTIKRVEGSVKFVQGDHNSEAVTLEIPRFVDGHDMSVSTSAAIHYDNEGSTDVYPVSDLRVDESNPEKVVFSWLVSGNATKNKGKIEFLVKFRCYDGDEIVYEWNTDRYVEEHAVSEGMDNTQEVVERSTDAYEGLRLELMNQVNGSVDAAFDERIKTEIWTLVLADGTEVNKTVFVP